jgi:hypothetical protein
MELWTDICSDLLFIYSLEEKYLPFVTRFFEFTGKWGWSCKFDCGGGVLNHGLQKIKAFGFLT